MLKRVLFIVTIFLLAKEAKCQRQDTLTFYFQNDSFGKPHEVFTHKNADFMRVVAPSYSADDQCDVKEFYMDGSIKFVGRADHNKLKYGQMQLEGDCISFFPNGKKQSIIHYEGGQKYGNEYLFYPKGTIYCFKKNISKRTNMPLYWECYNTAGEMITSEGKGEWIIYDNHYKNIVFSGPVNNGLMEGEWHGKDMILDSINFTSKFHKGIFVSGTGYDRSGKAYPYTHQTERITYKGGPLTFMEIFKSYLKVPKGADGKKLSLDDVKISFVVEKDGHVTQFESSGNSDAVMIKALEDALAKCRDWVPGRFYGIPCRTKITLPVDFFHGYVNNGYLKAISFEEHFLGF